MGRIVAQHGLHVTGNVNRLRPVERSQCERSCHSAMKQRGDIKSCDKLKKTATETRKMLVQVYGREAVNRKWFTNGSNAFAKGSKLLKMSHVRLDHRKAEPKNDRGSATNTGT